MRKLIPLVCASLLLGSSVELLAQQRLVKGLVTEADGTPIIGASVIVKGHSSVGVATNLDGRFSLNVPSGANTLIVSFMGLKTQEVNIQGKKELKIVLQDDNNVIQDVVVTGMSKVDKRLFTGAATKISGDKSKMDGIADVSRALEGKAAGVSVQNVSGTFGSAPKVRVRGATSIYGASKPLWVVDGVVMDDVVEVSADALASGDATTLISSAIAGLNADDIESFQVLKDGSATSIYGARAMAGVIVITTKKGHAGVSRISYTGEYTYRLKPNYNQFNIMNSQQQMSVYREMEQKGWLELASLSNASSSGIYGKMYSLVNSGVLRNTEAERAKYLRETGEYANTNWFDLLFNDNVLSNHSVSLSSGTDKMSLYASLSAMFDPGWTKQSSVNRYTANLNTTYKINPKLSVNLIANTSLRKQRAPGTLSQGTNAVTGEVSRDFDINPYSYALNTSRVLSPNENYVRSYAPFNIFNELDNNYLDLNVLDLKFQGELKYKPLKGLELAILGDIKYSGSETEHIIKEKSNQAESQRAAYTAAILKNNPQLYQDPDKPYDLPKVTLPVGGYFNTNSYSLTAWDFRASASYNKDFGQDILSLFGGLEVNAYDRHAKGFDGVGMQYAKGETPLFDYLYFKRLQEEGSNYYYLSNTRYRNVAMFANATYSIAGKYTLNGTVRYEGTNKMGKSSSARWLPTWNISGSWTVDKEKFFSALRPTLSSLVLKASYSLTADKGPSSVTNSTIIIKSATPWRHQSSLQETGYRITHPENSELTYEKKHELNLGLTAGLLKDRINFSFDWYHRNNFDLIGPITTMGLGGSTVKYGNVASMQSDGVEFSVSTTNIKTKNFSWTTDFVYAHSRNTVSKLENRQRMIDLISGTGFGVEGYPVRALFSIPFAGLNDKGIPSFYADAEHTQKLPINVNFQQREGLDFLKYEGSVDPTDYGSLGNTFSYKGLKLNVFLTYSLGNVVRLDPIFKDHYSDLSSMPREFENRWIRPGDEDKTNIPTIISKREHYTTNDLNKVYNAYNYSDVRIAKGDFVRLKEISLSYDLPKAWAKKLSVHDINVKLQATNLMLLYSDSKLNGQDPEFFNTGGVATPLAKQMTLTLRVGI